MVPVNTDRVRKLSLDQIHTLATEQYDVMSTHEYRALSDHADKYRTTDFGLALTNAFHDNQEFTVVGDYALDAILMAGIAEQQKDQFSDDEIQVMSHSWNELFSKKSDRIAKVGHPASKW